MFYYVSLKKILGKDFNQIYKISILVFLSAFLELISVLMISFILLNAGNLNEMINILNNFIRIFSEDFFIEKLWPIFSIIFFYISISVVFYITIIRFASYKIYFLVSNVRTRIIQRLLNQNYFIDKNHSNSKVISNIIYDASMLGEGLIEIVHLMSRLCLTFIISAWLFYVNPVITLSMMFILITLYLTIHFIITPKIRTSGNNVAIYNELLIKELSNFLGYIREIIFHNIHSKITNQLSGINDEIASSQGSKSFLVNTPRFLVDSLLLIILSSFILIAHSNGAELLTFYTLLATYGIAAIKLLPAIQNIFYYTQQLLTRRPNIVNLITFFDSDYDNKSNISSIKEVPNLNEKIYLNNITYKTSKHDVILKNISFEINFSDKVAIVGPSGSGKSCLMNIIIGLNNPTSGSLEIDTTKVNSINVESYREKISYIPQKIFLSEGTIKENILLFSKGVCSETRYIEALEDSGMKSILDKSDHDHLMEISEHSNTLSGGEKQCIGFARALYDARNIIALDEATASMDYDLANRVVSSILKKWETVICITHQSFLLPQFKKIIVMHDGEIQDFGTYEELFSRNEYFKNLCSKID